ncbi:hypothetical protein LCGC14_1239280 [marine sediment metagenome]|uniref:Uncharacterized protein n=1 Tax=marine sediment metagenome TaxID=412755 RepID=A0A0F9PAG3_9ZZZZ
MISDTCKGKAIGLDLITRTGQSLHAEWCRQMWKKGFHGEKEECTYDVAPDNPLTYQHQREVRYSCKKEEGMKPNGDTFPYRCGYYHPHLLPWPDLPEARRQEYLATAKAVLPEIAGEVFDEAAGVCDKMDGWRAWAEVPGFKGAPTEADAAANYLSEKIRALRDRRLEELG